MPEVEFTSKITAELVDFLGGDGRVCQAARVSTSGERSLHNSHEMTGKNVGLINYLMRDRHGVPFEHSYFTFYFHAPIFVMRELVKHRISSYSEESARYREMKPLFYVPDENRNLVQQGKPGAYTFVAGTDAQKFVVDHRIRSAAQAAYGHYQELLDTGIAREVARLVLPVNIYSSVYLTINARSMMNFMSLRRNVVGSTFPSYPQREIEILAEQAEQYFQEKMPVTHAAFVTSGRVSP